MMALSCFKNLSQVADARTKIGSGQLASVLKRCQISWTGKTGLCAIISFSGLTPLWVETRSRDDGAGIFLSRLVFFFDSGFVSIFSDFKNYLVRRFSRWLSLHNFWCLAWPTDFLLILCQLSSLRLKLHSWASIFQEVIRVVPLWGPVLWVHHWSRNQTRIVGTRRRCSTTCAAAVQP